MKRMQLVELEDLPWFPNVLRDGGTAYLELMARAAGHSTALMPTLMRALDETGATEILDLCSGGGGPARDVVAALRARGAPVTLRLTDRYPNVDALQRVAAEGEGVVQFHPHPVDATAVPAHLGGLRTLFNAFHHFPPDLARGILADAFHKRRPIAVFEVISREPLPLIGMLLTPLTVTLTLPFWRPFRWPWLLLTWLLPVMQAFVLWDGLVSWLRVYSEDELRALVAGLEAPDWTWEIGRVRLGDAPAYATYLLGKPTRAPAG